MYTYIYGKAGKIGASTDTPTTIAITSAIA